MKTLDRYIIRQFLTNFAILFMVVVGLIVLLDLIINFDEFVQAGQKLEGGWMTRAVGVARIAAGFYGPMLFLFYDYLVGLLPLGAAAFTLAGLIRHRELLAMLAGGVSMHRIAMPILALGFAANVLMLVNQEVILPHFADELNRSHSDLKELETGHQIELRFVPDGNGALFTAAGFDEQTHEIHDLTILQRKPMQSGQYGRAERRITAEQAEWDADRGGWRLTDGLAVDRRMARGDDDPAARARSPEPVRFVKSDLDPTTLLFREQSRYSQLLSFRQLGRLMGKPEIVDLARLQRIRHSRLSMFVINLTILAMGLPFFMLRVPQNLLIPAVKAAALCIGAWGSAFVAFQIAPGASAMLPAGWGAIVIAWAPVVLYVPLAVYLMESVET